MDTKTARAERELARAGVSARAFGTPDEAILAAEVMLDLRAIEVHGRWFTIGKRDARRLRAAGVSFGYLRDREGEVYVVRFR